MVAAYFIFCYYVFIVAPARKPSPHIAKDFFLIFLGVGVALLLNAIGVLDVFLARTQEIRILGSFLAGMFFTSLFTIALATVAIVELSKSWSPLYVAFWGGVGAMVGDMIIFLFIRDRLAEDLDE